MNIKHALMGVAICIVGLSNSISQSMDIKKWKIKLKNETPITFQVEWYLLECDDAYDQAMNPSKLMPGATFTGNVFPNQESYALELFPRKGMFETEDNYFWPNIQNVSATSSFKLIIDASDQKVHLIHTRHKGAAEIDLGAAKQEI